MPNQFTQKKFKIELWGAELFITQNEDGSFNKPTKLENTQTSMKPGWETILLMRKPPEGTLAQNVITYGTGGLNIDATRIKTSDNLNGGTYAQNPTPRAGQDMWTSTRKSDTQCFKRGGAGEYQQPTGRWPANVVLSHSPMCRLIGTKQIKNTSGSVTGDEPSEVTKEIYGKYDHRESFKSYGDENGIEQVEDWECVEGCPILEINRQSGSSQSNVRQGQGEALDPSQENWRFRRATGGYEDQGVAARYFHNFRYCAKTPTWERNIGCSDLEQKSAGECTGGRHEGSAGLQSPRAGAGRVGGNNNDHPTVKPLAILSHLSTLISQPNGIVLDPFMGSGSGPMAAVLSGFRFIGIELDPHYFEIAQHRIQAAEDGEVQLNDDTGKVEKVEKKKENAGGFNFYDEIEK